jgi:hypothetical protein
MRLQHEGNLSHSTPKNGKWLDPACGFRCLLDLHRLGYPLVVSGRVIANRQTPSVSAQGIFQSHPIPTGVAWSSQQATCLTMPGNRDVRWPPPVDPAPPPTSALVQGAVTSFDYLAANPFMQLWGLWEADLQLGHGTQVGVKASRLCVDSGHEEYRIAMSFAFRKDSCNR